MASELFVPGLLDGQVAIVTGGGTGLGRASALDLARCGAMVVACGRRAEPLEETAAMADRAEAAVCDIREQEQVAALVYDVLDRHGRIDFLLNNAGGQYMTPAEEITPKGFRTVMRLIVEGTWLMTHAVAARHFETETLMTKYPPPVVERVASTVPLGRLGRPEEIAWLAAFLASPAGDYHSGSIITVDGARDDWLGPWPPPGLTDAGGTPLVEERRPR